MNNSAVATKRGTMPSTNNMGGILYSLTRRGTYKKGVEPMVFIN